MAVPQAQTTIYAYNIINYVYVFKLKRLYNNYCKMIMPKHSIKYLLN